MRYNHHHSGSTYETSYEGSIVVISRGWERRSHRYYLSFFQRRVCNQSASLRQARNLTEPVVEMSRVRAVVLFIEMIFSVAPTTPINFLQQDFTVKYIVVHSTAHTATH